MFRMGYHAFKQLYCIKYLYYELQANIVYTMCHLL